jgi:hypothetical protein
MVRDYSFAVGHKHHRYGDQQDRVMTLRAFLENKGWEYLQIGPNEGQWLLENPDRPGMFHGWEGDARWRMHINEWRQQCENPKTR